MKETTYKVYCICSSRVDINISAFRKCLVLGKNGINMRTKQSGHWWMSAGWSSAACSPARAATLRHCSVPSPLSSPGGGRRAATQPTTGHATTRLHWLPRFLCGSGAGEFVAKFNAVSIDLCLRHPYIQFCMVISCFLVFSREKWVILG